MIVNFHCSVFTVCFCKHSFMASKNDWDTSCGRKLVLGPVHIHSHGRIYLYTVFTQWLWMMRCLDHVMFHYVISGHILEMRHL